MLFFQGSFSTVQGITVGGGAAEISRSHKTTMQLVRSVSFGLLVLLVAYAAQAQPHRGGSVTNLHWKPATATWYGSPEGDGSDGKSHSILAQNSSIVKLSFYHFLFHNAASNFSRVGFFLLPFLATWVLLVGKKFGVNLVELAFFNENVMKTRSGQLSFDRFLMLFVSINFSHPWLFIYLRQTKKFFHRV